MRKYVQDVIDIVIEQDFNPDFVLDGFEEVYHRGFLEGVIVAGAVSLGAGYIFCHIRRLRKGGESK